MNYLTEDYVETETERTVEEEEPTEALTEADAMMLSAEVDLFLAQPDGGRQEFLQQVFGQLDGELVLCQIVHGRLVPRFYTAATIRQMADDAGELDGDVYVGCASLRKRPTSGRRVSRCLWNLGGGLTVAGGLIIRLRCDILAV